MSLDAGAHDLRPEGKISHCDGCIAECNYFCCDFDHDPNSGNFMVMYPSEYERAVAAGWDMSNIEIIGSDADGGLRFTTPHRLCCQIPSATNGETPALGLYKSFECRVYPLWPYLHLDEWRFRISERCPIHKRDLDLSDKVDEIRGEVSALIADPRVKRWFQYQRCAGKYKEYPTRYDMPREAVVLPPEITPSAVVYSVTVNGRLLRYGVRSANDEVIHPTLALTLSDQVLACIVADLADAEYIQVHRPVSTTLLARLREIALDVSAPTRRDAGAPIPIVRASQIVPAVGSSASYAGATPKLEIICDHVSHDGQRVSRYSSTAGRPTAEERLESVVLAYRTTEPSPLSTSRSPQGSSAPR
ncbi:MAG: hypothetical protein JWL61_1919 [Gemmatimonadetes bacterium]|nr:hypothetical protein [Gemmatimonadota bacterium]